MLDFERPVIALTCGMRRMLSADMAFMSYTLILCRVLAKPDIFQKVRRTLPGKFMKLPDSTAVSLPMTPPCRTDARQSFP